jgi:hypothetical protein
VQLQKADNQADSQMMGSWQGWKRVRQSIAYMGALRAKYKHLDIATSVALQVHLHIAFIIPLLTYGCKVWAFHPAAQPRRDALRKLYMQHLANMLLPDTTPASYTLHLPPHIIYSVLPFCLGRHHLPSRTGRHAGAGRLATMMYPLLRFLACHMFAVSHPVSSVLAGSEGAATCSKGLIVFPLVVLG